MSPNAISEIVISWEDFLILRPSLGDIMKIDLNPFIAALRKKDTKKAREWLEQNMGEFGSSDEFRLGYLLALQGMVAAIESGGELSVIKRVINGEYKQEQVKRFIQDARERLSRKFRPKDEQGFDTAWVEVLSGFFGGEV